MAVGAVLLVAVWLARSADTVGGRPLVVLWDADPGTYDPHDTSHPVAQAVFRHVCEPLFALDARGDARGVLADDEVAFAPDGRVVTVTVRQGIRFHDGASLDAAAVAASFRRLAVRGVSPLAETLRGVRVSAGNDGRTVTFDLPGPNFEFVRLVLANPYAAVVSPRSGEPAPPGFVACTGPFRYAPSTYAPGRGLDLVADASNRTAADGARRATDRPAGVGVPRITVRFEADRDARLAALASGAACVLSVNRDQLDAVSRLPSVATYDATGGVTFLGFNFQRARWQDVRARRAVAAAIDPAALAALGPFTVALGPLAPGAIGHDPSVSARIQRPDGDLARRLLEETGIDGDEEVVLLTAESNTYRELASPVADRLAAAGLARVRVREASRADILSRRQDFDLLLFDYAWGDYTALSIFLGAGPRNLLGYPDRAIAGLVREALATADPVRRASIARAAQERVLEEVVWQPLLVRRITFAVDHDCVRGERQTPDGDLSYEQAETAPFR